MTRTSDELSVLMSNDVTSASQIECRLHTPCVQWARRDNNMLVVTIRGVNIARMTFSKVQVRRVMSDELQCSSVIL